ESRGGVASHPNPAPPAAATTAPPPAAPAAPPRLWPPLLFVALYWGAAFVVGRVEKPYFYGFLYGMASAALLALFFFGWWWTRRGIRFSERLLTFGLVVGAGVAVAPLCDKSIWFGLATFCLPVVLATWTLLMLLARKAGLSWNRLGLCVVVALTWAYFTLIRIDGLNSDLQPDTQWRWASNAESLFLAEKARAGHSEPAPGPTALSLSPGDWPSFRGP